METIFSYLKPYRLRIILQMSVKLSGALVELLLPWMLSHILDEVVPRRSIRLICMWGGAMVFAAAVSWIASTTANRMAMRVSKVVSQKLRYDLFEKITALSGTQADAFTLPSLSARLTTDTYYIHQMLDRVQRTGARVPSLLLGGMIVTFAMEPVMAMIFAMIIPILCVLVVAIAKRGALLYNETQTALDGMVRKIQEFMTGVRVIKALSKTEYECGRFRDLSAEVSRRERGAEILMALSSPSINIFFNLGLIAVIVVGAMRVDAGVTKPGVIVAFLSYFTIILNNVMAVARLFVNISRGTASADRIQTVLRAPRELAAEPAPAEETPWHIEFRDVSFSYKGTAQPALSHLSFALKKGQLLGVIGPTGSGKSTLVNLLLRLYDIDSGQILIDGRPIRSIPHDELYHMFGVVFQNDFVFADTLRENIAFGRDISDSWLEAATQTAQAAFMKEKPGGLDYRLNARAANLSGGQKQRLLISRALAANPPILILDDCSSALDYKTDAQLRGALRARYAGATGVIVAQRISSIMHTDRILILEDGALLGSGTHEELLRSNESYREIFAAQMGGAAL